MTVIVCVDDKLGMMFSKRRLSKDIAVIERILTLADGNPIWMSAYSAKMFENAAVTVDDDYIDHAPSDAICFAETDSLIAFAEKANKVILYRWNRRYPANRFFDLDLSAYQKLTDYDFSGNSHDRITEEVYVR